MPRRNVVNMPRKTHNENATIIHACNTDFVLQCKNKKVVARKLGAKCKGDKTCIWVPNVGLRGGYASAKQNFHPHNTKNYCGYRSWNYH
jgi:hypothetical protein